MTYNPANKVEPKFKVKYAGNEYNVLEVKDIAGITFYGIEDEPNHIDYVKAENCEIIGGYAIKENGSAYPTKPAEWSEEDCNQIETIACHLDNIGNDAMAESLLNIMDKYKSHRPQPKVELTKLDKNILEAAIAFVEQNNRFNCWGGVDKHTVLSALHSLRPQNRWKPSEEQMKILYEVLNFAANHESPHWNDYIFGTLNDLIRQLKKLKE